MNIDLIQSISIILVAVGVLIVNSRVSLLRKDMAARDVLGAMR